MRHGIGPLNMHDAKHKDQTEAGPTLLELVLRLHGDLRRSLKPIRVTPLQAGVLCYLHLHADARLGAAAAALHVQPPTLVVVVQDLVRKHWVTNRRSVEDRRVVCLRLSRQGETIARTIAQRVRHMEATLTEDDRGALGMTPQSRRA